MLVPGLLWSPASELFSRSVDGLGTSAVGLFCKPSTSGRLYVCANYGYLSVRILTLKPDLQAFCVVTCKLVQYFERGQVASRITDFKAKKAQMEDRIKFSAETQGRAMEKMENKAKTSANKVSKKVLLSSELIFF